MYYIVRNRFIYIRKFYKHGAKFALLLFWTLYSFALMTKLYMSGGPASAIAVRMALVDGLRKRFGGQNERVTRACKPEDAAVRSAL